MAKTTFISWNVNGIRAVESTILDDILGSDHCPIELSLDI